MLSDTEKRARLEKALEYGGNTHTVEDVVALVKDGRAQWWENGDGCIVGEFHAFPRFKAYHYWLISGEKQHCLDLDAEISAWAVGQSCSILTACGRRGWGKLSAPLGWLPQPHMHSFYKPLVS